METNVSLPDDLFERAETQAQRYRMSRSQFYATALSEYLERHDDDNITRQLDELYSRHDSKVDSPLMQAQLDSIEKDSW